MLLSHHDFTQRAGCPLRKQSGFKNFRLIHHDGALGQLKFTNLEFNETGSFELT